MNSKNIDMIVVIAEKRIGKTESTNRSLLLFVRCIISFMSQNENIQKSFFISMTYPKLT